MTCKIVVSPSTSENPSKSCLPPSIAVVALSAGALSAGMKSRILNSLVGRSSRKGTTTTLKMTTTTSEVALRALSQPRSLRLVPARLSWRHRVSVRSMGWNSSPATTAGERHFFAEGREKNEKDRTEAAREPMRRHRNTQGQRHANQNKSVTGSGRKRTESQRIPRCGCRGCARHDIETESTTTGKVPSTVMMEPVEFKPNATRSEHATRQGKPWRVVTGNTSSDPELPVQARSDSGAVR